MAFEEQRKTTLNQINEILNVPGKPEAIRPTKGLRFLSKHNFNLKKSQIAYYAEELKKAYEAHPDKPIAFLRIRKVKGSIDPRHPLTLWIIQDVPYLVMPASREWKQYMHKALLQNPQARVTYPKPLVPLVGDALKHVLVYRGHNASDTAPQIRAALQHEHAQDMGIASQVLSRICAQGTTKTYFLTNYIDGDNIGDLMDRHELTPKLLFKILPLMYAEVSLIHAQHKKVHLDIKPDNFMYHHKKLLKHVDRESMKQIGAHEIPARHIARQFAHPDLIQAYEQQKPITFIPALDVHALLISTLKLLTFVRTEAWQETPHTEVDKLLETCITSCKALVYDARGSSLPLAKLPTLAHIQDWFSPYIESLTAIENEKNTKDVSSLVQKLSQ